MDSTSEIDLNELIRKRTVLSPGKGDVPNYQNGTKVTFHFKTEACYGNENDPEIILIDNSKNLNKPMELFIGKQFKFPLWEEWLKHMRLNEISQLNFDWKQCRTVYPLLSKSYRSFAHPKDHEHQDHAKKPHCCGMTVQTGTGYQDLDNLVNKPPQYLRFTIELINVEHVSNIDKEIWLMSEQEMQENVPILQSEGNRLFSEKRYPEAALKYRKALAILEQLMTREKPGDQDWKNYDLGKIPLLCNLSQCELFTKEYYQAIQHTDEVLEKDPKNIKALYRRAKAHTAVWNVDQAKKDFQRLVELDSTLSSMVKQHLIELDQQVKRKAQEDMQLLKGKLF